MDLVSRQAAQRANGIPYWRLSGFYFFYFALLGALLPYWALYLQHTGFSVNDIGLLMAMLMGTKIVAPNLWGWLADRSQQRLAIIRVGALLAALIFSAVFLDPGFWGMLLVILGFSFFWNAILPQFEVITLDYLQQQPEVYSRVRLWGSVGFIITAGGLGPVFAAVSVSWLPTVLWLNLIAIWLCSYTLADHAYRVRQGNASFLAALGKPQSVLFFIACFLMQLSHGPYYGFFSIFMKEQGYGEQVIGALWALGVIAEVVLFVFMHRLMLSVSLRALCVVSLLLAALRWAGTAWLPEHLGAVVILQVLHAATFGVFHAVAIQTVHIYFPPATAGQGQAFYSAISFGAGGALGAWLSGYAWQAWGGVWAFGLAAAVALIAAGLMAIGWQEPRRSADLNAV